MFAYSHSSMEGRPNIDPIEHRSRVVSVLRSRWKNVPAATVSSGTPMKRVSDAARIARFCCCTASFGIL